MTPRLKKFIKTTSVALGVTSIYLLWLIGPLVSSTHYAIYHWSGSPFELFVPPILDFCAFWMFLTLVLMFATGRARVAIWCGMVAVIPWMEFKNWAYLTDSSPSHLVSFGLFVIALIAFLVPLTLWPPAFEKNFERAVRFASTLLLLSAASGVVILCEFAWFGWQARALNTELSPYHAIYRQSVKPRVIWIVFDELSYQQVYERRFPGLKLPSFDALSAQATVFTNAIPAGILTGQVLPSLITGDPIDAVRSSSDGKKLSIHNSRTGTWQLFDEHDTVFQDALNLGYSNAVAGWYIPYCRILPDVLGHCFWTFDSQAPNTMVPGATLRSNLMRPWMRSFGGGLGHRIVSLFVRAPESNDLQAKQHILDYVALAKATDQILEDRSSEFAFIHMPIPHPSGIYDRTTDKFVLKNSTYVDNLALTDKLVGHIRSKLEQSGQWDATTLVIMADHSWRTELIWKNAPEWTKEEDIASRGGEFDDRPAYIVKLPEQHTGTRIDAPFAGLNTRRLLDALLSQKIRTKEDLAAWVNRQRINSIY
jgi:hypothetical protein